jgi:hypothetical protein
MTEIDYRTLADEKADLFIQSHNLENSEIRELIKQTYKIAYVEGHLDAVNRNLERLNERPLSQLQ